MNPQLNRHPVMADFFWLTKYTNPYGTEVRRFDRKLRQLGFVKDDYDNYILDIGQSNTVFAAHLDTADNKMKKVRRVVVGDMISTDGTTLLGADDRAGVAILLHLIRNQIPGRYVLFVGEESGRIGSSLVAASLDSKWYDYHRMICWDRYGTTSIITHQMGVETASSRFTQDLADLYRAASEMLPSHLNKIDLSDDAGGTYTDSYSFIDIIPECTNISVGYEMQHTNKEYQDGRFLISMAEASLIIPWESLPTEADPFNRNNLYPTNRYVRTTLDEGWWDDDNVVPFHKAPMRTADDIIDAAVGGWLDTRDVEQFVFQYPEEASWLLDTLLREGRL